MGDTEASIGQQRLDLVGRDDAQLLNGLLLVDPVYKWASTRWPTFVQVALYVIDHYVPEFGDDAAVMPLGGEATAAMLMNASRVFEAKGMDWQAYYNQTGAGKNPFCCELFRTSSAFVGSGIFSSVSERKELRLSSRREKPCTPPCPQ